MSDGNDHLLVEGDAASALRLPVNPSSKINAGLLGVRYRLLKSFGVSDLLWNRWL